MLIVGVLMILYVTFGGMIATTWVQIIKAFLLLIGASIMAFAAMAHFGFSLNAMFGAAVQAQSEEGGDPVARPAIPQTRSRPFRWAWR